MAVRPSKLRKPANPKKPYSRPAMREDPRKANIFRARINIEKARENLSEPQLPGILRKWISDAKTLPEQRAVYADELNRLLHKIENLEKANRGKTSNETASEEKTKSAEEKSEWEPPISGMEDVQKRLAQGKFSLVLEFLEDTGYAEELFELLDSHKALRNYLGKMETAEWFVKTCNLFIEKSKHDEEFGKPKFQRRFEPAAIHALSKAVELYEQLAINSQPLEKIKFETKAGT